MKVKLTYYITINIYYIRVIFLGSSFFN